MQLRYERHGNVSKTYMVNIKTRYEIYKFSTNKENIFMRITTKVVALIVTVLLIISSLSVFASCDNINYKLRTDPDKIEDKTGKMSNEIKSEIQLAYYESNNFRYYT